MRKGTGQWGPRESCLCPLCWDCPGAPEGPSPPYACFLWGTPCWGPEPSGNRAHGTGATGPAKPGHPSLSPSSCSLPKRGEQALVWGVLPARGSDSGWQCPEPSWVGMHTRGRSRAEAPLPAPGPSELCARGVRRGPRLLDHRSPATGNQHPGDSSRKACWTSDLKAENPRGGKGSVEAPSPDPVQTPQGS